MALKIKSIIKTLFVLASVAYPVMVFYFLIIRQTPLRLISLFVMAFAILAFIAATSRREPAGNTPKKKARLQTKPAVGQAPGHLSFLPCFYSAQALRAL